jgi:hypothetical protein
MIITMNPFPGSMPCTGLHFENQVQQRHCTRMDVSNDDVRLYKKGIGRMVNLFMGWRTSQIDRPSSQSQSLYGPIKGPHAADLSYVQDGHELISSIWMLQSGVLLLLGGSSWCALALLWISDDLMLLWYHKQWRELQTIVTSYIFLPPDSNLICKSDDFQFYTQGKNQSHSAYTCIEYGSSLGSDKQTDLSTSNYVVTEWMGCTWKHAFR